MNAPAFPQQGGIEQLESAMPVQGMSLRDYFAAKAMQSLLLDSHYKLDVDAAITAGWAYAVADEMLKAREA